MNFNFELPLIFENQSVLIRPLELSDVAYLVPIATADAGLIQYSPSRIHTPELLHEYISVALEASKQHNRYPFIIFDKTKQQYAGSTSFLNISSSDLRLEIGATWLGPQFQRSGLNRQCKFFMLEYAFDYLRFERVGFFTDERNLTSRTAIEKIGGIYEGILRSHTLMPDGFRRNTVSYSILREEWAGLKSDFLGR